MKRGGGLAFCHPATAVVAWHVELGRLELDAGCLADVPVFAEVQARAEARRRCEGRWVLHHDRLPSHQPSFQAAAAAVAVAASHPATSRRILMGG